MKILICGDSFAADYTVKYKGQGWPNMLANKYQVTNLAQAGCSEYKILQQLDSIDFNLYDRVIVSHTSPYRIYVKHHPIHYNDVLHKNCDLIYLDLKEHSLTHKEVVPIVEYFEKHFDVEYACEIHNLLCEKIENKLSHLNSRVIHITNINWTNLYQFKNNVNFESLFINNQGLLNHLDNDGNKKVFQEIVKLLEK